MAVQKGCHDSNGGRSKRSRCCPRRTRLSAVSTEASTCDTRWQGLLDLVATRLGGYWERESILPEQQSCFDQTANRNFCMVFVVYRPHESLKLRRSEPLRSVLKRLGVSPKILAASSSFMTVGSTWGWDSGRDAIWHRCSSTCSLLQCSWSQSMSVFFRWTYRCRKGEEVMAHVVRVKGMVTMMKGRHSEVHMRRYALRRRRA